MINWLKEKIRRKSKLWFTSDLHFSHFNVINYCNRPFKTREEMNDHIIKIWNKTVKPHDFVFILGDFSLNPKVATTIAPQLNGLKCLVSGNHDATFISNKKSIKMITKYLDNGFDEVHDHLHWITLKNGMKVLLSHLPYIHNNSYDDRYKDYKPYDNGEVLLHGHLHGRYIKNDRQIDVGWDAHQKLLNEDDIINIINDPRTFIPSHLANFYAEMSKDNINSAD